MSSSPVVGMSSCRPAWAPTPTTTTGIDRPRTSDVRFASRCSNSGRNALASGITNASNCSLTRAIDLSVASRVSDSVPLGTTVVDAVISVLWTECAKR